MKSFEEAQEIQICEWICKKEEKGSMTKLS